MVTIAKIILPLPPRGCSTNGGGSARGKAKDIKAYRDHAHVLTLQSIPITLRSQLKQSPQPLTITAVYYTHRSVLTTGRYRPQDEQNGISSLKAAVDGIADSKIIPDDSSAWLHWGTPPCRIHPKSPESGEPRVEITLTADLPGRPSK